MAKVAVNFDINQTQIINEAVAREIGVRVAGMSKRLIATGQSPVKGYGRYERYGGQRKAKQASTLASNKNLSKSSRAKAKKIARRIESEGYPETVKDKFSNKKTRPVNLSLNGWYLKHLTWWISKEGFKARVLRTFGKGKRNFSISIGFSGTSGKFSKPPKKVMDMFETHNEGMHPHVPQRKHLPTGEGEEFKVTIMREVKKVIEKRITALIDKANKNKK